jgi:hypothetical protein
MHHLLRMIDDLVGPGAARAILGWGLILFPGFFLSIYLIWILDDIRVFLLAWWSP